MKKLQKMSVICHIYYDWQRPLDFIWDHLSIVYGVYFTNLRYPNKFQGPQWPKSIVSAPLNVRNSEKIEFFDKEWINFKI